MLERATIGERAYGPDHVELASTLWNLYEANRALGDTATKQREILERALAINERAYGPDRSCSAGAPAASGLSSRATDAPATPRPGLRRERTVHGVG